MFGTKTDPKIEELTQEIRDLRREVAELTGEADAQLEIIEVGEKIKSLQREVSDLEITRDKERETRARERRDIEHKIGLERMRFEEEKAAHRREVEAAKREAKLEAQESGLATERKAFEKEIGYIRTRFDEELQATRDLMQEVLDRVPKVDVQAIAQAGSASPNGSAKE